MNTDREIRYRRCAKLALIIERREVTAFDDLALRLAREQFEQDCADLKDTPELDAAIRKELVGGAGLPEVSEKLGFGALGGLIIAANAAQLQTPRPGHSSLRNAAKYTPMAQLSRCLHLVRGAWHADERNPVKAYIFVCLSELAYLHLTDHELVERDRYKVFMPSTANAELRRVRMRIDLQLFGELGDFGVQVFDTIDYIYVVMRVRGAWVVAVRGTHSLGDLLTDLRARKLTTPHGRFHKGFAREALIALPLLKQRIDNDWPIYFTGHSMGAAVAAILSHEWTGSNRVLTPYMYAVPRFADRSMSHRKPVYNYVRPWDMIPHVPPRALGYASTTERQVVVPSARKQRGVLLCTLVTLDQAFATHSIEGYRAGLGREVAHLVGPMSDETVYIDRMIRAL